MTNLSMLRRSCARKYVYTTARRAQRVADRALERDGKVLAPYACRFCGLFHLYSADHPPAFLIDQAWALEMEIWRWRFASGPATA
jgi:hypothetical protein